MMYAIDAETYWDKHYSLTNMGPVAYCRDERFNCYQVSIVGAEGVVFVGDPKEFDWNKLRGSLLVAHNAAFDSVVFMALQRDGVIPKDMDNEWVCTADLSVYFQGPRNLQGACRELLDGMVISKAYRAKTKGKTVAQIKAEGNWQENWEASAADAIGAYKLAERYLPLWPAKERRISAETRKMGIRGIQIDVPKVEEAMSHIANLRQAALRLMVWANDEEDTPLSPKKIREYGRSVGIAVPASLAATSPDAKLWFETYGETHPWVLAVRDYRRLNTIYKKLKILRDEVDENGVYSFSLKYFGANTTGRFSGAGKFNLQNLPRGKLFGIDMRSFIIARPGHRLLIADHAQIEARLLLWRVSDTVSIQLIKQVGNIYVAYAIRIGRVAPGTTKKQMGPVMYLLTKSEVLGLGYGMGKSKYLTKTNQDIAAENGRMLVYAMENGLEKPEFIPLITPAESEKAVMAWRANNPLIVSYWKHQDTWLKVSASHKDPTHEIVLKSGRKLIYHNPTIHVSKDEKTGRESVSVTVRNTRGDTARHYYGGKLVENEIQATARDILCDGWLALIDSGRTTLFHAHDEFVNEVPIDQCTQEECVEVRRLMIESSPWAEGAPLDVDLKDMKFTDCYGK